MTNKITITEQFNDVRAFLVEKGADEAMIAFIDGRIEQVKNKNAKRSDKPTKAQTENAILAEAVIEAMPAGKALTVSEIQKIVPALTELSNQRATAVIRSLVRVGRLTRTESKGKAFFALV